MRETRALALAAASIALALAPVAQSAPAHTTPAQTGAALAAPAARASSPAGHRIRYQGAKAPQIVFPDGGRRSIRSLLDVSRPMAFGDYVWDGDGVPPGPLWVRVDIGAQLISVFRGEHEIGTAVILYGGLGKPTPVGAFHVLQKAKDYVSHTYDAPMPFMLRLTGDGVAIHASNVRPGWATHGCIGVPMEFAKRLFAEARLGDTVLITGGSPS
jgi:hypothetical protein